MEKTVLTMAREAYEPPYAGIMEFAVEGGFAFSSGVDNEGYGINDGTEMPKRDDVEDSWY